MYYRSDYNDSSADVLTYNPQPEVWNIPQTNIYLKFTRFGGRLSAGVAARLLVQAIDEEDLMINKLGSSTPVHDGKYCSQFLHISFCIMDLPASSASSIANESSSSSSSTPPPAATAVAPEPVDDGITFLTYKMLKTVTSGVSKFFLARYPGMFFVTHLEIWVEVRGHLMEMAMSQLVINAIPDVVADADAVGTE